MIAALLALTVCICLYLAADRWTRIAQPDDDGEVADPPSGPAHPPDAPGRPPLT